MKKFLTMCMFMFALLFAYKNVYAEEYYRNDNGVSFTEAEYNFFTDFFYDGYQKYMTQAMFDEYVNEGFDFENAIIRKVSLCPNKEHQTRDITYYDTEAKGIQMAQSCGILCRVSAVLTWHGTPIVQSHDTMGAYIDGPTRITTPSTIYSSSAGGGYESALVYDIEGYGAVVALPDAPDIKVSQSFAYTGNGFIFMSYQHALSNISLSNAQLFEIGLSGYGNVFNFYGAATNVYDQMNGVYMTV